MMAEELLMCLVDVDVWSQPSAMWLPSDLYDTELVRL